VVNDSVLGSGGTDTVHLKLPGIGTYTLTGSVENGIIFGTTNGVNLTGNASANYMEGSAGNNVLNGLAGNDTIVSGGGNDTVDGGTDVDTLVFAGSASDYVITRPLTTQTVFSKLGSTVIVTNVEFVQFGDEPAVAIGTLTEKVGSPGNDSLQGTGIGDTLDGSVGNDTVMGLAGDDTLWGGVGLDLLIGGEGTDILDGGDGSDTYRWNIGDGDDIIAQNDTIGTDIDVLQLAGVNASQMTFTRGGFTYNDLVVTVQQGEGDLATFESITVADYFNNDAVSTGTIDQVVAQGSGAVYTQALIKAAVNAGPGGGNDGSGVFFRFDTNDSVTGTGGNDWVLAGAGNDTVAAGDGADIAFGGLGNDSLMGGAGEDWVVGGAGADTISGGEDSDILVGGAGGDTYLFNLGDGWDLIIERAFALGDEVTQSGIGPVYVAGDGDVPLGADVDTVRFGAGIAEFEVRATRSADDLVLTIGTSGEQVHVANYFASGVSTIERVQFASGATWTGTQLKAKVLVPSGDADEITGYLAGERLNGLGGDDTIDGRDGNDTITGGDGSDTVTGGRGNDRFVLDSLDGIDTITDFTAGTDLIALSNAVFSGLGAVGTRVAVGGLLAYDSLSGELSYDGDTIAIIGTSTHPASLPNFLIVA
jgi:Ca2+-binding RTX toxin-like protein